ncbi:MAG: 4-hydroxythreonine-4-phosphate dehydrogenase PdxA [Bacteroidia bacterium]|nr:4-hydroxythreonine-4-phosphate dehydrogenase PdxA [Bacteroidia bacterium]MDW8157616.1 4-hydroxythreonine-4-phosphate dehydrogenase PdxA [Bacteroidia bacterium]
MQEDSEKVVVGITMGDVNGIGPELLLKVFSDARMLNLLTPVIFGSGKALYYYKNLLKFENFTYQNIQQPHQIQPGRINFVECSPNFERVEVGIASPKAGYAAFQALERALLFLKEGKLDALVTLPVNKAVIQNEKFRFPGHTEYLAEKAGVKDSLMLMIHENLRIGVVTGHIPLRQVAQTLSFEKVYQKIKIFRETLLVDFGIEKPKIAVLALNPHAGDNGLLGFEEKDFIQPAINKAYEEGIFTLGPYPADSFFTTPYYQKFDGILAMYHDQGLIPFKTITLGLGVNFTAGLPFVRTSPDHGTAYDIAGTNSADETSFRHAIFSAIDIFRTRKMNQRLYANAMQPIGISELISSEDSILNEEENST